MKQFVVIGVICAILGRVSKCEATTSIPEEILLGSGSSAYQVEGAWDTDGKGVNIWDKYLHDHTTYTSDSTNGDISCNSYNKWEEDVELITSLGLQFYRFSISWARILPTGVSNKVNTVALEHYKNFTKALVDNGIEPVVTIYHWDHPQALEDMGGWTNELIVDWFVDYATILFTELGDYVKIWTTINEPDSLCQYGYETPYLVPAKVLNGDAVYQCGHNALKAHAAVYHAYQDNFNDDQGGKIGLVLSAGGFIPAHSDSTSEEAVERQFQFDVGWLASPLYLGDYPEMVKSRIANYSEQQGYAESRLPEFSTEWQAKLNGSADYLGINHYSSRLVALDTTETSTKYNSEVGTVLTVNSTWASTAISWIYVYPEGLGVLLRWIKEEYDNPPVWVMENGYPDSGGLEDYSRISYHHDYISSMLSAVVDDGCDVRGYGFWSFLDSFEWGGGYTHKFGLHYVNFTDADRPRTAKLSASWWKTTIATRELQDVPTAS